MGRNTASNINLEAQNPGRFSRHNAVYALYTDLATEDVDERDSDQHERRCRFYFAVVLCVCVVLLIFLAVRDARGR